MRKALLALTAAAALAAAGSAGAATMVTSGPYTLSDKSFGTGFGVHSDGTQSGTTLDAHVNIDGSAVTFTSTVSLSQTGSGEATLNGPFDNLNVSFAKAWDSITFAFDTAGRTTSDMVIFINGSASAAFDGCAICTLAKSGEQKFTLTGPGITTLKFTFSSDLDDAKQFRVDGLALVPEPGAWAMMILGIAGIGAMLRRRGAQDLLPAG